MLIFILATSTQHEGTVDTIPGRLDAGSCTNSHFCHTSSQHEWQGPQYMNAKGCNQQQLHLCSP